ncbi:hypothetical protein [Anaerospora hongkongensis]|uniref:hypothetical protein n=1 Tax=Anaerospora hongkongensis TaxID=244830 RepID=UPI00289CFF8D|nr:hypothetical protein [Anaerospora hongkongensis]
MWTLVNSLPWFFWVLWGSIGGAYILFWVLRSTKSDPVLWRIGWVLMVLTSMLVVIDNLIRGTSYYIEWLPFLGRISMPMVIITCSLIFIGGFQKTKHPDFDPEKRRKAYLYFYSMIITMILLCLLVVGRYLYIHFFK